MWKQQKYLILAIVFLVTILQVNAARIIGMNNNIESSSNCNNLACLLNDDTLNLNTLTYIGILQSQYVNLSGYALWSQVINGTFALAITLDNYLLLTDQRFNETNLINAVRNSIISNISYHETNFKHGNTTDEIRSQFTSSNNISIINGQISFNGTSTTDLSNYPTNTDLSNNITNLNSSIWTYINGAYNSSIVQYVLDRLYATSSNVDILFTDVNTTISLKQTIANSDINDASQNSSFIRVGTKLGNTTDEIASVKVTNATYSDNASSVSCSGITGATSNLCSLVDTVGASDFTNVAFQNQSNNFNGTQYFNATRYDIGDISNANGIESFESGNLFSDGYYYAFRIYAMKNISGTLLQSANYYYLELYDTGAGDYCNWNITIDSVTNADFYRIVVDNDGYNGYYGNYYQDSYTTDLQYDGTTGINTIPPTNPSYLQKTAQFNGDVYADKFIGNMSCGYITGTTSNLCSISDTNYYPTSMSVSGTTTKTLTLNRNNYGSIQTSWTDYTDTTTYVPYTGATATLNLNNKNLTNVQSIVIGTTTGWTNSPLFIYEVRDRVYSSGTNYPVTMYVYNYIKPIRPENVTTIHRAFYMDYYFNASNFNPTSTQLAPFGYYASAQADGTVYSFGGIQAIYEGNNKALNTTYLTGIGFSLSGMKQPRTGMNVATGIQAIAYGFNNSFNINTYNGILVQMFQVTNLSVSSYNGIKHTLNGVSYMNGSSIVGIGNYMYDVDGMNYTQYIGILNQQYNLRNGSITNYYGIYSLLTKSNDFKITNYYGLYISNSTYGTSNTYSIYSVDGNNYFGGNVGIKKSIPLYPLHVSGNSYMEGNLQVTLNTTLANLTVSGKTTLNNITMLSPNTSSWCCGVSNIGTWSCSAGQCV